jgi:hypothetical protein
MVDLGQLQILQQGVAAWNQWRSRRRDISVNLREADLRTAVAICEEWHRLEEGGKSTPSAR